MYLHQVRLIFLPLKPIPHLSEQTELQLVTEDFLTLARITNAIFLQASLIRKNLDVRETIAEFLKIDQADLSGIVDVDAQLAISRIENLRRDYPSLWKRRLTPEPPFLEISRDLKSLKKIQEAPLGPDISADDVNNGVVGAAGNLSELETKCQESTLDELTEIIETYTYKDKNIKESEAPKEFDFVEGKLEYFIECMEYHHSYSAILDNPTFWNDYSKYESTYDAVSNVLKYVNVMIKHTSTLKEELEISMNLRKNWDKTGTTGAQIQQVFDNHIRQMQRFEPKPPVLTVAFREPKEMQRIDDDLKSPWFQKHFVRGSKAVKILSKALEPLGSIYESIQKLDDAYQQFRTFGRNRSNEETIKKTAFALTTLEKLTAEKTKPLKHDDIVDNSNRILTECLSTNQPDADFNSTFKEFETQEKDLITVLKNIVKVREDIERHGKTESIRKRYMDANKDCLMTLKGTMKSLKKREPDLVEAMHVSIEQFRECTGENLELYDLFDMYLDSVKLLKKLRESVKAFQEEVKRRAGNELVKFNEVLKKSKVMEMEDCLKTKGFHAENLNDGLIVAKTFGSFLNVDLEYTSRYLNVVINLTIIFQIQTALKTVEDSFHVAEYRTKRAAVSGVASNPVLSLNNSKLHSENLGICTVALLNMVEVQSKREDLKKIKKFDTEIRDEMKYAGALLRNFRDPEDSITEILKKTDQVNKLAKQWKDEDPSKMAEIFYQIAGIDGIIGNREGLAKLLYEHRKERVFRKAAPKLRTLISLNLDFQTYKSRLLDGRFTVITLKKYFDEIFGHVKKSNPNEKTKVVVEKHTPVLLIILIGVGILLLLIIGVIVIYGLTKKGREKYKNLYLFHFGKPEEFEKRWRYSSFMDKVNGENALLGSIHEINKTNMLIALKRGVYINAYNKFGNTALHSATKAGHPELVDALIRHGADRTLLNVENRTPEQMIPFKFQIFYPERAERYEQIQNIYKKYQKKKYKIRVPEVFPLTSYRIWIEDRTDDKLTNQFMDVFQSITSIEASALTTHCVMKTDENGVLVTDNTNLLFWIFNGSIIVKEQWMIDCIQDQKLIQQDFKYLIEKVQFKGVLYDTVLQWSEAMAKGDVPYLYGVQVAIAMKACSNIVTLSALITNHGGILLDQFPDKSNYNSGSHPYMHSHLGPLFVLHDGETDLSKFKNDKMFTLFTEGEFIAFMLRRDIKKDSSENPICVLREQE
ncbi:hypothetical protein CRE_06414 [Caenorhabditis remanei]|uniref:BRCT domain-containing protein n=1 Tax=Caenorhabditis remanei TaxID=31234 RepID=E3M0T4_CAERE|nr:hypothetical protein CRE_06414 [Caenorhabditis remanei]